METRSDRRILRFGAFELDPDRRRLSRGLDPVRLPERQLEILLLLAARAGHVVAKETLIERAWQGQAVSDNSLTQAVSELRRALGTQEGGAPFIETEARLGYRFAADVAHEAKVSPTSPEAETSIDALLEPYRAFVDGRAALETLDHGAIGLATDAFSAALAANPGFPAAHIGLANAHFLAFESTRADIAPNRASLLQAEQHAREACRLDPSSGDAWGTLAVVLHRTSPGTTAVAAARKAVDLEPREWRHYVRLAFVSWGGQRLSAATKILSLCPGLAMAHWFAATVFVAREAFGPALDHLRAGCAMLDENAASSGETGRFSAVGLHLLHGLVIAARDFGYSAADAHAELERELAGADANHIYARECRANAWYAIGALHVRESGALNREGVQRPDKCHEAVAAFESAIAEVPGHALASVGLAFATGDRNRGPQADQRESLSPVDAATVHAAALALRGRHDEAARVCGDALALADQGAAGWLLPIDPLLHVSRERDAWTRTLALLRARAS